MFAANFAAKSASENVGDQLFLKIQSDKIMFQRFSSIFQIIAACLAFAMLANAHDLPGKNSGAAKSSDESAREDRLTGGAVKRAKFEPGNGDIRITVDVPAFLLTLWQGGKEVAVYHVGVGMKDFPISIGAKTAKQLVLNPDWYPPDSDWVLASKGIKPGERIRASDPRNPLGRIKIPLGYGYLLHEAKGAGDLGSLVSHGCVRVMPRDLIDLSKKIASARELAITDEQIDKTLSGKKQNIVEFDEPLEVDINYDTMVVENGKLHIYPDVYDMGVNTIEILKSELVDNGVDTSVLTDATLKKMLARAVGKQQFVVAVSDVKLDLSLTRGKVAPVVARLNQPARKK